MGTIVKRENGRHQARWFDAEGHRRAKTFTGRSAAQRALRKLETEAEEIRAGLRDPHKEEARRRTFGELAAYWLEHRVLSARVRRHRVPRRIRGGQPHVAARGGVARLRYSVARWTPNCSAI